MSTEQTDHSVGISFVPEIQMPKTLPCDVVAPEGVYFGYGPTSLVVEVESVNTDLETVSFRVVGGPAGVFNKENTVSIRLFNLLFYKWR